MKNLNRLIVEVESGIVSAIYTETAPKDFAVLVVDLDPGKVGEIVKAQAVGVKFLANASEVVRDAVKATEPEESEACCHCENCDWEGTRGEIKVHLADIPDLPARLDPGATVPAGECPDCGAFCYLTP